MFRTVLDREGLSERAEISKSRKVGFFYRNNLEDDNFMRTVLDEGHSLNTDLVFNYSCGTA